MFVACRAFGGLDGREEGTRWRRRPPLRASADWAHACKAPMDRCLWAGWWRGDQVALTCGRGGGRSGGGSGGEGGGGGWTKGHAFGGGVVGGQGVALVVRVVVQWRPRAVRRRPMRRQR